MFLTSLMHRDELFDITLRWLNDDLRPEDGQRMSEIFVYEGAISAPSVQRFMLGFLKRFYGRRMSVERVCMKDQLRQSLLAYAPHVTPRIAEIAAAYREHPEEFYPGMPVDAALLRSNGQLVSISRIKRPQRVAEKAAFRMADALAGTVRREAEAIAAQRASARGVALDQLVSTELQMRADFIEAERHVAAGFRRREIVLDRRSLTINDVIGFKLVADEADLVRAEAMLAAEPGVTVVEHEEHRGDYNATNLLLDIDLPPVGQLVDEAREVDWSVSRARGLDPAEVKRKLPLFVESGARRIRTEVILTTYPELIESELGKAIHELRIRRLRERQPYSGQIAENARFLLEYMIAVAYSPATAVPQLPIKMWGRYLPDTVITAIGSLFGVHENGIYAQFLSV